MAETRRSGIDLVPEVRWGTHLCQFYRTEQDLIDVLVPYFEAGLEGNEFCMWVTAAPLGVEDAKRSLGRAVENLDDYLEKGQIEILDYAQWYTRSGAFEADAVLQGWVEKEADALKSGFEGLRLTGNTSWLDRKDWNAFSDYEAIVDRVIGEHKMLAICSYALEKCGAVEVLDVVMNHEFALIRREGQWVVIQDTRRKRTQQEFATLAKFPGENPNPVLQVDGEGMVLYANKGSRRLLEQWGCAIGNRLPDEYTQAVTEALDSGVSKLVEATCADRLFALTVAPLADAGCANVYGLDITERKQAEEEHQRLRQRIQEAQRLESLGVLAGGIAHDFSNMLMGVLGNASLALRDLSPVSPALGNIRDIETTARRAADLCTQLLGYSGKGRFVVEPIDLTELVEEMAHMLKISISKMVVLRYDLSKALPAVKADATQMRQIIMNLITNASDAIGDKSGMITISTGAMECDRGYLSETYLDEDLPEGVYVYMEVSDTGCGMDEETSGRIFDPYFTTKERGRGLGLAAVLGIVRGHKGALKVYSEVGKGTTLKVLFPAAEEEAVTRARGAEDGAAGWTGSGTVLLVDDEEIVRAVGSKMLKTIGFDVIVALDGWEAVAIYRERGADIACVILDLTMPHAGGEESFRELRRLDRDVRVILSSGYNEQEVTGRFAGKGLAGFIKKPYDLHQLREKLREVLGD